MKISLLYCAECDFLMGHSGHENLLASKLSHTKDGIVHNGYIKQVEEGEYNPDNFETTEEFNSYLKMTYPKK